MIIVHDDIIVFCNNKMVHLIYSHSYSIIKITFISTNHESMDVFAKEKLEIWLCFFEYNDIDLSFSNDNNVTLHKIDHDIYDLRHQSVFIKFIKVNKLIFNDGEVIASFVSADKPLTFNAVI